MRRVAVIGAGVLGAAIAWRLAGGGHAVTVIDPRPGGIASRGSFGWLNAASAEDEPYARLRIRSLRLWHEIARAHPHCPVAFPGMLLWEVARGDLERLARWLTALGHPAELVGRAEIARLEPGLARPPEAALWLPTEGRAEPLAIADWFVRAAVAAGATLCPDGVTAIERRPGGWEIALGVERITAEELVIAAGAATAGLLAPLDNALALRTEPGLLVRTSPAPETVRRLLGSPEVHLWQAGDGTVLAGSDYGGMQRFDDPHAEARVILARAEALAPELGPLRADSIAVTGRPMLPDDRPAVGRLDERLSVAVTHSGMTLAPVIAEAIAALVDGRPEAPELAPYPPDRPALCGSAR